MVHGRTLWCARAAATLGVGATLTGFIAFTARAPALAMLVNRPAQPALRIDAGGAQGLDVPGRELAPGDTVSRRLAVANRSDARVQLSLVGTLRASAPRGIDLKVTRCSRAWTANVRTGGLECAGAASAVGGWLRLNPGRPATLPTVALRGGGTAWLEVALRLPASTPRSLGGRTWNVDYRFAARA
jgi:hypothetical protein